MKKVYVAMFLLFALVLTGCSFKVQKATETTTDETGSIFVEETVTPTVPSSEMEEFTGEFDTGEVSTVEGSENVNVNEGLSAEVDNMINERNTQPKDDTKLTEEDIDLMQQIIDKIKDLGK